MAIKLVDAFHITLDWVYLGDASKLPQDIAVAMIGGTGRRRVGG
jgi:hypothetical protein